MKIAVMIVLGLAWTASLAAAQDASESTHRAVASLNELNKEQMEPWTALKEQLALFFKRDWDKHDRYLHPKLVDWGTFWPSPLHFDKEANAYFEQVAEGDDKVVAYTMVPVSVVVAGDTAIINAYVHALTKPDGKSVETIYRLHNTWKKEDGQWQLLATYNSVVSPKDNE